jgi:hypothetical protein
MCAVKDQKSILSGNHGCERPKIWGIADVQAEKWQIREMSTVVIVASVAMSP